MSRENAWIVHSPSTFPAIAKMLSQSVPALRMAIDTNWHGQVSDIFRLDQAFKRSVIGIVGVVNLSEDINGYFAGYAKTHSGRILLLLLW